jgi:stress response protein SCP2
MPINNHANPRDGASASAEVNLKEIVMGVHWDPPQHGAIAGDEPTNLDALCVLFDEQEHALEVVHPGHPSNINGSVVHTGDSRTGASEWDDERIFVFLDALPDAVSALAFVVASVTGRTFSEVPGASCHVSDRVTEHEWIRVELSALGRRTAHCVATLRRGADGWNISPDAQTGHRETLTEVLSAVERGKSAGASLHPTCLDGGRNTGSGFMNRRKPTKPPI